MKKQTKYFNFLIGHYKIVCMKEKKLFFCENCASH